MLSHFPAIRSLNGRWHDRAMRIFMAIILLHLAEHICQAFQFYVLGWSRPQSLGFLGLFYPWLIHSEWLHYGHALFMLVGVAAFLPSMHDRARFWWMVTFYIAFWHHIEHALLLGQVIIGQNLFNSPVPLSVLQSVGVPRLELHLFYNLIVTIPMAIALSFHKKTPPIGREWQE
jgi:hypothetical protein